VVVYRFSIGLLDRAAMVIVFGVAVGLSQTTCVVVGEKGARHRRVSDASVSTRAENDGAILQVLIEYCG
jgi:hypothetical protein